MSIFISLQLLSMEQKPLPQIFLINGSSTAGKTTLAHALQKQLHDNYEIISFDEFRKEVLFPAVQQVELIPKETTFTTIHQLFKDIWDYRQYAPSDKRHTLFIQWCALVNACTKDFYDHIEAEVQKGKKCIVDTIIMQSQVQEYAEQLKKYNCYTIFTHIDKDMLKERVEKRNATQIVEEQRNLDRIIYIYPMYYTADMTQPRYPHDKVVNTGIYTAETLAQDILKHFE